MTVRDVPRPGIAGPLARVRKNGVDVAEVAQGGAAGSSLRAPQTSHEVGPLRDRPEYLALEARTLQDLA